MKKSLFQITSHIEQVYLECWSLVIMYGLPGQGFTLQSSFEYVGPSHWPSPTKQLRVRVLIPPPQVREQKLQDVHSPKPRSPEEL